MWLYCRSKQAQRCYCEAPSCTGWIGEDPDKQPEDERRKEKKKKKREEYLDVSRIIVQLALVKLFQLDRSLTLFDYSLRMDWRNW